MTTLQTSAVNADILRNLGIIANDEGLLNRAARYLRKLVKESRADSTRMSREEFFRKIDEAEKEIADGKGISFENVEDLDAYIRGL